MTTTTVNLKFQDVLGAPLDDHSVLVDIFSLDNTNHIQATVPLSGQTDVAIQLQDCPLGTYRFELSPTNYRVIQFFLTLPPGGTVVRQKPVVFPVDPARVIGISAPAFAALDPKLQGLLNAAKIQLNGVAAPAGERLYAALPPNLKAALLNLFLKSSNTRLGDGTSCFDHVHIMSELDQDRLFATVDAALVEDTINSPQFHSVDFSLHKEVPPYKLFSSFKTLDAQGNLQLTFSRKDATTKDCLVDMDIDEAQGIGHVFEVIGNVFTGLTNPYNIREILMAAQGLRPLYTFQFAQRKTATVAAAANA